MRFMLPLSVVSLLASLVSLTAVAQDPARLDLLFIGDSHSVGSFGHAFDEQLRGLDGATVRTYASCGSRADSFYTGWVTHCGYLERVPDGHEVKTVSKTIAPTPLIAGLLAAPVPAGSSRVTLVALGSNSIELPSPRPEIVRLATDLRKSGSACVWIGPPRMRKFGDAAVDRYYKVLSDALHVPGGELCTLIDSRKYTAYPATGGDGVHYVFPGGPEAARRWAAGVFDELKTLPELRH